MSRNTPPPLPPPKDQYTGSSRHSSYSNLQRTNNTNSYYDNPNDLAEAIRDTVHISNKSSSNSLRTGSSRISQHQQQNQRSYSPSALHQTHSYTRSSPDMSHLGPAPQAQQPILPSAMVGAVNPFEEDEVEPERRRTKGTTTAAGGVPARQKISRATTSNLPPSPTSKTRPRRSLSSDSYGRPEPKEIKELSAGQKKAAEDKKGSRHADVIDTWDPTGLGSAMWHHSGPYDAAAPSRNTNLPLTRAPMQAFHGPAAAQPPRTTPTSISLVSPPVKEEARRVPKAPRRTSGGLSGQYSTSMPASGGYFPDVDQLDDEVAMMRKERQRQREEKRRALKAAWGTDTPEPWEDFGGSPLDENAELAVDEQNPDAPKKSPGFLGLGPRTPPIKEEGGFSASLEHPQAQRSYSQSTGQGGAGVARKKSLMQKIKTMRDPHRRAGSPSKTTTGESQPPVPALPSPDAKSKPTFFSRTSGRLSSYQPGDDQDLILNEPVLSHNVNSEFNSNSNSNVHNDDFVVIDSPNFKAKSRGAPTQLPPPTTQSEDLLDDHLGESLHPASAGTGAGAPAFPVNRVKNLPTPPVGPVLPDFNDLMVGRRASRSPGIEEGSVKRKPSVVKRLRDRVAK